MTLWRISPAVLMAGIFSICAGAAQVARADEALQPIINTVLGDRGRACQDTGGGQPSFGPLFSYSKKLEAIAQEYARHEDQAPADEQNGYGTIRAFLGTGDPQAQAINFAYRKGAGAAIGTCAFKEFGVGFYRDNRREVDFVVIVLGSPTPPASELAVNGVDLPGGDYRHFDVQPPTGVPSEARPDLCEAACTNESGCKAWTYVHPGLQGRLGRCWLKNVVAPAVPCNGCTSGATYSAVLTHIDYPGNDIGHIEGGDVAACQAACYNNLSCTTWTYVRPGVQGPQSRCWMKQSARNPVVNDCCTSGNAPPRGVR